jgi:hypothetical protein
MIPATEFARLSGNSAALGEFEGETGGTCDINRREIDSQRRGSIESARADTKEEM